MHYEVDLETMVAALGLDRVPQLAAPVSADPGMASLELESRAIILWGVVLERFLRAYLQRASIGDLPLDDEEMEERFKVAFDERTQPLTRFLLMKSRLDGSSVSLAELAARRYRANTPSFRKLQRHLLRSTVYPMRDLQLWRVEVEERTLSSGKSTVARYKIAGPALLEFFELVYRPMREGQLRAFAAQHLAME
jgi:hypothetical protein